MTISLKCDKCKHKWDVDESDFDPSMICHKCGGIYIKVIHDEIDKINSQKTNNKS